MDKEKVLKEWFEEQDIGVKNLKGGTVGDLIWQARGDEKLLWRAGRNVFRAITDPLPDGRVPEALCDTTDPQMRRLYGDQPNSVKRLPLFDDFYFLEPTFARFHRHYEAVKGGYEEERMILWMWGVGGVGKSEIMKTVALRFEDFDYPARDGCEFHGNPLYLVPRKQREALYRLFYFFKGNPCGSCQDRVRKEYENRWWDFPVERIPYSLNAAHGIAFVEQPLVPKKEGDYPGQWYHILQHEAPGGILILGCTKETQPQEFIRLLGEIAQSGSMNVMGSAARVDLDIAVIILSNTPVRQYMTNDPPFYRRVTELLVPAVVSSAAEKRIHAKLERFTAPLFHFMPEVENALNLAVCVSRLRDIASLDASKLMERLFLYDGMLVPKEEKASPIPKTESFQTLNARYPKDGMEDSLMLGAAIKIRAYAREKAIDGCVSFADIVIAIRNQIDLEGLSFADASSFPKKLLGDEETDAEKREGKIKIGPLEAWYQQRAEYHLAAAWMGPDLFYESARRESERYLDHADAHVNKRKFVDEKEEEPVSEGVLKKVEEQIGVLGSAAETFRQELVSYVFSRRRRGEKINYTDMPRFEEAILKKVAYGTTESPGPLRELRIGFDLLATDKPRDPDKERKRREALVKNLSHEQLGYRECCVRKFLGEDPGTGYLRQRLYPKK